LLPIGRMGLPVGLATLGAERGERDCVRRSAAILEGRSSSLD
jgi:hypothetical protein